MMRFVTRRGRVQARPVRYKADRGWLRLLDIPLERHRDVLGDLCRLRRAHARDRRRSRWRAVVQPKERCDRNRLPSRLELHLRIDVSGDQFAALCRHLLGGPHYLRAGSRVPVTGGAGVRWHDRRWSRSATQRFPLCLLYSCRLSRAACHGRPGLAGSDDGSGRDQGLSRDRRTPSALFFTILACARHRLGMAVHGGLSDGSPFMTDTHYDRAPGDASALPDIEQGTSSGVLVYSIGLALAVVL